MLFVNAKGQAEKSLNREQVEYRKCYQEALSSAEALLDIRHEAVQILHECEAYLQKVTDHPYKYDLKSRKVNKDFQELEKKLKNYKEHKSGAGFLLGTGVAVLGPNVMLAAATTFGTASTGAAISSLGGAAAVNAAFAWLGGGALTVGGAGILGGQALLALAGPVGIAVAASCSAAAGLFTAANKRKAQQVEVDTAALKSEITLLRGVKKRVEALQAETASLNRLVKKELDELKALKKQEYSSFSGTEAKKLATMMNNGQSLKEKVVEIIPLGR